CIKGFLSCGIYNFFLCQGRMAQCTPHRSVQWGGECECVCVFDGGKERVTMKKSVSTRSLNKSSSFPQADQRKAVKTGWSVRLGHTRRALSSRAKEPSSSPSTSSSSPCLFSTAPPPPKRAPSTTLTLRSKSMTAELEELASVRRRRGERLDEMLAPQEHLTLRSQPTEADYRAATVKQRPTGRRITSAEISSLFERQGMALHGGLHPGIERAHMQLPRGMSRTKSFGATEEDRLSALAGEHRFPRSSSMTDSLRDHSHSHSIPPPPQTAPPPPPSLYYLDTGPPPSFCPPPPPARGQGQGHDPGGRSSFKPSSMDLDRPYDPSHRQSSHLERQKKTRSMIILQDSSHLPVEPTDIPRPSASATPPERIKRKGRVIDNPYANVGQFSIGLYTPTKPQRKKSPLVKQLQVASIALAAAHSREPSPSGRHPHTHGHTHTSRADYYQQQLMVERERMQRRLEERRKSTVFLSVGTMEGGSGSVPEAPSYTTSRSIDERLLSREFGQLPPPALALRPSPGGTTFIHPLTGKPLDPNSPLALALAARERALTSQTQSPASSPEPRTKQERAGAGAGSQGASLFIDSQTKEPQHGDGSPGSPQAGKPQWGASSPTLLRQEMEGRVEERKEERRTEDKKSLLISIMDTSQQKTAGLIMAQHQAQHPSSPAQATLAQGSSEEDVEPYTVNLPPAMLSSSDEETREELKKIGVLPPPDEFANGLLAKAQALEQAQAQAQAQGTPVPQSKSSGSAADSGVEEADTHSSSERERDHHLETTSTVSTVSSMSTLLKSHIGGSKGPVTFRDPLLKQSSDTAGGAGLGHGGLGSGGLGSGGLGSGSISGLVGGPGRPRYLFQRRSKLWGDQMEARGPGVGLGMGSLGSKPSVIGELSSRLQQLNKDTRSLGEEEPLGASLDPGRKSPVTGARVNTLREAHQIDIVCLEIILFLNHSS
ncbi:unnamed protein product, partial [Oncorhynchus mykiss]